MYINYEYDLRRPNGLNVTIMHARPPLFLNFIKLNLNLHAHQRPYILGRGFVPVPSSFAVKSLGLGVRELKMQSLGFGVRELKTRTKNAL